MKSIKFRLLHADEIECRIARMSEKGVYLLLYKTARTDYKLLDETLGVENWQNDYKIVGDTMYCGIGIRDEFGQWIWKWNAGTESNMEAEKGQASDAMKRAGFAIGIGRELYSAPTIFVPSTKCNITNGKCYDKFYVQDIGYDKKECINKLIIHNHSKKCTAFEFGSNEKTEKAESKKEVAGEFINNSQVAELDKLLSVKKVDITKFLNYFNADKLENIKVENYDKAITMLKKKDDK